MVLGLVISGCITPLPAQPASVLARGTTRVGGGISFSPWCSFSADPLNNCSRGITGIPLPEVRVDVRHGLGDGWDVGGSGRWEGVIYRGFQAGLLVDLKKEIWAREIGPRRRQILSLAPALSADVLVLDFSGIRRVGPELSVALPLLFGHQTDSFEWVVSPRLVERLPFDRGFTSVPEFGVALGVYGRGAGLALQLAYQAPIEFPRSGLFQVSVGGFIDFGGAPAP